MKWLMVALFAYLFATGCVGSINEEFSPFDLKGTNAGTASALINGNTYVGSVTTAEYSSEIADRISLGIIVYKDERRYQKLELLQINPQLADQEITRIPTREACRGSFLLQCADTVESRYIIDDKLENTIHIDSYDKKTGILKGSFRLNLYKGYVGVQQAQGFPDTLIVTEGKFDVCVKVRTCLTCM